MVQTKNDDQTCLIVVRVDIYVLEFVSSSECWIPAAMVETYMTATCPKSNLRSDVDRKLEREPEGVLESYLTCNSDIYATAYSKGSTRTSIYVPLTSVCPLWLNEVPVISSCYVESMTYESEVSLEEIRS